MVQFLLAMLAAIISAILAYGAIAATIIGLLGPIFIPSVSYTHLPTTEKIMEAATGDKEFWIVDVVGNFCFVHPAKQGISSNLNLITDKGNIYSLSLIHI